MRRLAAATLLVAVLWAGNMAPATAGDDGGAGDACRLLTRAEIRRALGQEAARPTQDLGSAFCEWRLKPTAQRAPGQVNTLVEQGRAAKRDFAAASAFADAVVIDGVGRRAVFVPSWGAIFVLGPGRTLFTVQVSLYTSDALPVTDGVQESLVALATRAEARL